MNNQTIVPTTTDSTKIKFPRQALNYVAICCKKDSTKLCGQNHNCDECPFDKPLEYYAITTNVWQACPICKGDGIVFESLSSSLHKKCVVCNGKKILNNITGLPPQ